MLWNSLGLLPLIPNYSWPLNIGFNCTGPLIRGLFSINTFTFLSVVESLNAKDQLHALISAILYDKLAPPQIQVYMGVLEPIPQWCRRKTKFWGSHEFYVGFWPRRSGRWRGPLTGCCRFNCTELKSSYSTAFSCFGINASIKVFFCSLTSFYHRFLHSHKIGSDF